MTAVPILWSSVGADSVWACPSA